MFMDPNDPLYDAGAPILGVTHPYSIQGRIESRDNREELDRLINLLDDEEIKIAIRYLANLLTSRAKPHVSRS